MENTRLIAGGGGRRKGFGMRSIPPSNAKA
jgi:hypothetical protein